MRDIGRQRRKEAFGSPWRKGQVEQQPEVARENQRMTNGLTVIQRIPDELLLLKKLKSTNSSLRVTALKNPSLPDPDLWSENKLVMSLDNVYLFICLFVSGIQNNVIVRHLYASQSQNPQTICILAEAPKSGALDGLVNTALWYFWNNFPPWLQLNGTLSSFRTFVNTRF